MIKFTVFVTLIVQIYGQEGCTVNIAELNPEPIVFDQFYNFLYPPITDEEDTDDITISIDEIIILTCPGGYLYTDQGPQLSTILATCNQDSQLVYDDKILNFTSVRCSNSRPETVKVTDETCANNGQIILIGYEVGLNINFVPLIRICFDFNTHNPLWNEHNLIRYSAKDSGIIVELLDNDIYNLTLNYTQLFFDMDYQRKVINGLVGLPETSRKYVDSLFIENMPLSWGQDFAYGTQANASAHLINSVPQWPLLHSPTNWESTEESVFAFAQSNKLDLEIYTGTYGICTLPHEETGEDTEIYLYVDDGIKAIPLPEIYWKLIFDPITRRATAFLTVNNPFQTNFTTSVFCNDISDAIPWLTWIDKEDAQYGYSYACTYRELKETITYLPDLDVTGILV